MQPCMQLIIAEEANEFGVAQQLRWAIGSSLLNCDRLTGQHNVSLVSTHAESGHESGPSLRDPNLKMSCMSCWLAKHGSQIMSQITSAAASLA